MQVFPRVQILARITLYCLKKLTSLTKKFIMPLMIIKGVFSVLAKSSVSLLDSGNHWMYL